VNKKTILYTTQNGLCTGCGICEDVCPTKSIKIIQQKGLYVPILDKLSCISHKGCEKCLRVCSGHAVDLKSREQALFITGQEKTDRYIGKFVACYSGYSSDYETRFHSASGGLLSQFLVYLLTKGYIQGAVVTGFDNEQVTKPRVYIATTPQEILKARSSKYCPVSMNKVGNNLCEREGKYVIVGLPCHIQGFRKREVIDANFRSKIFGYFSLYCSSTRTFFGTEYLLKHYRIDLKELKYFAYRDEGCLGSMKATKKNGTIKTVPFLEYYPNMRSFFVPQRCLSCIDHYGSLAEISFGDIYTGEYKNDKIGVNSVIVRSNKFNELFQQANKDGQIVINEISPTTVNESQEIMLYPRKRKVYTLQLLNKFFGKPRVSYDEDLRQNITFKDVFRSCITNIQIHVGRRKYLWFMIDLLKKKR